MNETVEKIRSDSSKAKKTTRIEGEWLLDNVEEPLVNEDDIKIDDRGIAIEYKVTAPLCPFSSAIGVMIKYALEKKLNKPIRVKLKEGHFQSKLVNEILESEGKRRDLLEKLESYGNQILSPEKHKKVGVAGDISFI